MNGPIRLNAAARADRILMTAITVCVALASATFGASVVPTSAAVRAVPLASEAADHGRTSEPLLPSSPSPRGSQAVDELLAQHRCLAQAMYYEARGEGEAGELAVAEVVVRRLRTGRYGSTICAVVYAGAPRPGCQFSFACDGSLGKPNSRSAWRAAEVLATKVFAGELPLGDSTGNALNYHAVYVHPAWADRMVRTARIGRHVFLGPAARSPRRSAV